MKDDKIEEFVKELKEVAIKRSRSPQFGEIIKEVVTKYVRQDSDECRQIPSDLEDSIHNDINMLKLIKQLKQLKQELTPQSVELIKEVVTKFINHDSGECCQIPSDLEDRLHTDISMLKLLKLLKQLKLIKQELTPDEQYSLGLTLATAIHKGQFDLAGADYILHPIHVAKGFKDEGKMISATIAILHDVIEGSEGAISTLFLKRMGFWDEVVYGVDSLTKRKGEDYLSEYIPRVMENELAMKVKLADLEHNSDLSRFTITPVLANSRSKKYRVAKFKIESKLGSINCGK